MQFRRGLQHLAWPVVQFSHCYQGDDGWTDWHGGPDFSLDLCAGLVVYLMIVLIAPISAHHSLGFASEIPNEVIHYLSCAAAAIHCCLQGHPGLNCDPAAGCVAQCTPTCSWIDVSINQLQTCLRHCLDFSLILSCLLHLYPSMIYTLS